MKSENPIIIESDMSHDQFQSQTFESLKEAVASGRDLLQQFQKELASKNISLPISVSWNREISECLDWLSTDNGTVIGLLGESGAGKSSFLSALLDEESIAIAGCSGACTSAPTVYSYNDGPYHYGLKITYRDREDVRSEMMQTYGDLEAEKQLQKEKSRRGFKTQTKGRKDSVAAVGIAKIQAMFHDWDPNQFDDISVDELLDRPNMVVLDTTYRFETDNACELLLQLQDRTANISVVTLDDSKGDCADEEAAIENSEVAGWPLVKLVEVFVKSDILANKLQLVDMPGLQDSNPARREVTEVYMRKCSQLIVMSDISRAATGEMLESLITDNLMTQILVDGNLTTLTVVCTKTDQCPVAEICSQYKADHELSALRERQKVLQDSLAQLENTATRRSETQKAYSQQDSHVKKENRNRTNAESISRSTYHGTPKRKAHDFSLPQSNKTTRFDHESSASWGFKRSESPLKSRSSSVGSSALWFEPLTKQTAMDDQEDELSEQLNELARKIQERCILKRNSETCKTIQDSYRTILERNLDEAIARDDDLDACEAIKSFCEDTASDLQIFCVSSRAYQQLCGRLQNYDPTKAFHSLEMTEIPQVQRHCRKLAEERQKFVYKAFLLRFGHLHASLDLWFSGSLPRSNPDSSQKSTHRVGLETSLKHLNDEIKNATSNCVKTIELAFDRNIVAKLNETMNDTIQDAVKVVHSWSAPTQNGGLAFNTYSAICRRNGTYESSKGHYDWNQDLASILIHKLSAGWNKFFSEEIEKASTTLINNTQRAMLRFLLYVRQLAGKARAADQYQLQLLHKTLDGLCTMIDSEIKRIQKDLSDKQNATSELRLRIQERMLPAYQKCAEERGPGMLKRMHTAMHGHVDSHSDEIFGKSLTDVTNSASQLIKDFMSSIERKNNERIESVRSETGIYLGTEPIFHSPDATKAKPAVRTFLVESLPVLKVINSDPGT